MWERFLGCTKLGCTLTLRVILGQLCAEVSPQFPILIFCYVVATTISYIAMDVPCFFYLCLICFISERMKQKLLYGLRFAVQLPYILSLNCGDWKLVPFCRRWWRYAYFSTGERARWMKVSFSLVEPSVWRCWWAWEYLNSKYYSRTIFLFPFLKIFLSGTLHY